MLTVPQCLKHAALALGLLLAACTPARNAHPEEAGVRTFLNTYFSTWSNRDMDGYGACFHQQARIVYLPKNAEPISQGLTDFLHGQRMSHEQAAVPMKEVPLEMTIQMDDRVAQAQVTWLLTKKDSEERGTDFFTLKRDGKSWKIVSLVFYGE